MLFPITRVFICLLVFSLALVNQATGAMTKLKVGYLTVSAGYSAIWVAKDAGLFEKNGLDADIIYIPPAILTQAMVGGEVPVAMSGGSTPVEATLKGADFVLLGSVQKSSAISYIVTRKGITRPEQLKGKKMGISRIGAASHRVMELALKKLGIDPERDVSILQIGNSGARMAALDRGSIDGTALTATFAIAAKDLGHNILADVRKLGIEYLTSDLVTTRSFLKDNEDTVRRFVKSMVDGIHFFLTQKDKSKEIMSRYMRVRNPKIIETGYNFNSEVYQRKPYVTLPGLKAVLEAIAARNPKAREAKPEQFYDMRFVKELDESGYIDNLYKQR